MYCSPGEKLEWPFPGQIYEAEDEVYGLQYRYRFDGGVKVLCQEVEEEFGPEEAMETGGDVICGFTQSQTGSSVMRVSRHGQERGMEAYRLLLS